MLPATLELLDELLRDDPDLAGKLARIAADTKNLSADTQIVHKHFNKPQLRSMSVGANEEYAVWGRGTGKSEGLIAPRTYRNMQVMPGSHGCFVGATYLQLLERTLPPVVKGWEAMGLVRGRDFWIRERPPRKLGLKAPLIEPISPEHSVYMRIGQQLSVASMVSQDRPGSSNGKTVHWLTGDEAKFLDKPKLDNETLMTNRGDERYFGGIPEFHSVLFCTDMPTVRSAMWILDQEKYADPNRVQLLLSIQAEIYQLQAGLISHPSRRNSILAKIGKYQQQWDALRSRCVFFSEASTLDNLAGFGLQNILKLRRMLPHFIFSTAILNKRPFLTENSFYPDLADGHFYDAYDYAFIDSFEFGEGIYDDCRKDADLNRYEPIDVALDYGSSINTLLTGQPRGREYLILKELYVKHPQRLRDVARQFCTYYRHHKEKTVRYFYDHTAISTTTLSTETPAEIFSDVLREEGWTVEMVYLGHTEAAMHRYELWGRCLRGYDPRLFRVRFNRGNCEYVRTSMQQAQMKESTLGFGKDKKDEKKLHLDQRETTHFSDCADTLLVGANLYHRFEDAKTFDALFLN